jgi:hypothetical protein
MISKLSGRFLNQTSLYKFDANDFDRFVSCMAEYLQRREFTISVRQLICNVQRGIIVKGPKYEPTANVLHTLMWDKDMWQYAPCGLNKY